MMYFTARNTDIFYENVENTEQFESSFAQIFYVGKKSTLAGHDGSKWSCSLTGWRGWRGRRLRCRGVGGGSERGRGSRGRGRAGRAPRQGPRGGTTRTAS